jgi:hypothetical protein
MDFGDIFEGILSRTEFFVMINLQKKASKQKKPYGLNVNGNNDKCKTQFTKQEISIEDRPENN